MKRKITAYDPIVCVSAEELILYRESKLSDARKNHVNRHVRSCLLCLDALLHVRNAGEQRPLRRLNRQNLLTALRRVAREARKRQSQGHSAARAASA